MMKTPGSTAYFGAVGKDAYGDILEKCANSDGVRALYQKNPEVPTGTCAVLINGRERSLIANLAAANTFSPSHLEGSETKEAIAAAKLVYISGFFLTVSIESLLTVTKKCVEDNKIFCLNLAAPFIIQFFADQLAAAMPFTDFIFANESEAATYGETHNWGNDLETVALKLAAQPKACGTRPRIVVFTQGSRPTIVASAGVVTQYQVDPLPTECIVDTNGAGDAFVGGFISQLVQGKTIAECCRAGHFAARTIIQRSGCSFPKECDFY
jgi:adenosine kinase